MGQFLYKDETYRILGACFEVYNEQGSGFLEAVYQECLEIELQLQGIPYASQERRKLFYKGRELERTYTPDFICHGSVILEIKEVSELCSNHRAQLLNYLHATDIQVGLLVNFGQHPKLEYERMIHTPRT